LKALYAELDAEEAHAYER